MKIVIYGATSTIAQEIEKLYALPSNHLILIGRNNQQLERIQRDLKTRGNCDITIYSQDLDDLAGNKTLTEKICSEHRDIDLAFWAQGTLGDQYEIENDVDKTLKIFSNNFISHVVGLTVFAQYFEARGCGHIVVITSVAGERGKRSNYIYGAAKAAKITFLSGLRARLFSKNVFVTDIRLGFVDSKMTINFKKGILWVSASKSAILIKDAIMQKKDVCYVPLFWNYIMFIIRLIPEMLFKRIKI